MTLPGLNKTIRVVVVDDSPTASRFLVSLLQSAEGIDVVGVGNNGEQALRLIHRLRPDVVTMDIRMPNMDGLEATRHVMQQVPTPIVIVATSLVQAGVDLSFEALRAGALAIVRKPGLADVQTCGHLVQTVRLMASVPVVRRWGDRPARTRNVPPPATIPPAPPVPDHQGKERHIEIIGIAASTGGPGTLLSILSALPNDFPIPLLVVQHITRGFTAGLASWLDSRISLNVRLGGHGEPLRPGSVLVAPDDYHMQVSSQRTLELHRGASYKGLRPSANLLFHSLASVYGARAMGIILTGMGDDGADGLLALHQAGGYTIAQDPNSCVVYGMPAVAIAHGAVDHVLTLEQITLTLRQLLHYQNKVVSR